VLENEADAAVAHRNIRRVLIAEIDMAAIGIFEAGDHAQDGRLARARRTEQRDQLAAFDRERNVPHGAKSLEGFDDVVEADFHEVFSAGLATRAGRVAGRRTRPAPWRSSATLAMMVKTAISARMEEAAKAPAAW